MIYDQNKPIQPLPAAASFDVQFGTRNESGWSSSATRKLRTDPTEVPDVPPLLCRLYRKKGGTYAVIVTDGCVCEVIPKHASATDDSIVEWAIEGIWDDTIGNLYKEHAIQIGQTIGVAFNTTKEGYIDGTPFIDVRDVDENTSAHYTPPVGEDEGAAGDCFYTLASCKADGDSAKLEVFHSGSNIDYIHDLAPFVTAENASGVDIFNKYNIEEGQYEYKGIVGIDPVQVAVNEAGNTIEISLLAAATGKDLDLAVKYFELEFTNTILGGETGDWTGGTRIDDGGHSHSISLSSISGTGTISSLTLYGVTGVLGESSFNATDSGEHKHTLAPHGHIYGEDPLGQGYIWDGGTFTDEEFGSTGAYLSNSTFADDGWHSHDVRVTGSDISFSVSLSGSGYTESDSGKHSHNVRVSANLVTGVKTATDLGYTLCWRAGSFVGQFASGAILPPASSADPIITKTIYTWAGPPT